MAVTYEKLNDVLKDKNMTMSDLRKKADIAPNTMTRIRKNEVVSLDVLGRMCGILGVNFGDIVDYIPEDNNQGDTMTDQELKKLKDDLWTSADQLRAGAHLAANKYGQPILGLIFLRYADILFKQHKAEIMAEYEKHKGGRAEKSIKDIAIEKCGFFLPECAYYDTINDAPDDANKATLVKNAMQATIDDEKINRARLRMAQLLDTSVTSDVAMDDPNSKFAIHGTKIIDLSKIDIDGIRAEIKTAEYKAVEIDDLKDFIEQALQRMLNRNCTRNKFSQRYKSIIDRYNAGGSENEDYYEQLLQLIEDLKKEESRAETEGLTEEELEMYDLLIAGKKLTKAEEQKVKLAAKNLFKKLSENKKSLLVVDWYKDDMPREKVKDAITTSLDADLPESYDKESFQAKISLLLNHFMDMAIQGYGWIANVA